MMCVCVYFFYFSLNLSTIFEILNVFLYLSIECHRACDTAARAHRAAASGAHGAGADCRSRESGAHLAHAGQRRLCAGRGRGPSSAPREARRQTADAK